MSGESDGGEGTLVQKETRCLFLADESLLRRDLVIVFELEFDALVVSVMEVSSDSKAVMELRFFKSIPGVVTEVWLLSVVFVLVVGSHCDHLLGLVSTSDDVGFVILFAIQEAVPWMLVSGEDNDDVGSLVGNE